MELNNELAETFRDKEILVTGGCGSIGSEIVRQLLNFQPRVVKVLDHNEGALFNLSQELSHHNNVRYLVGNIRDKDRLKKAVHGSDFVFHAAAMKHVPMCEYNPFEAVGTNVIGTQNLIDVAREEGVEKVVAISTDKAANPISTMGATKLLSEKLIINAPLGNYKTIFSCVRFGNVLDSSGSILPIVREQIRKGGPITVTDYQMTRFFMPLPQAVSLVLRAAKIMKGRETFILKMGSLKITDLIEVLVQEWAPKYGKRAEEIGMKLIGKRPGERINEYLMFEDEAENVEEVDDIYVIRNAIWSPHSVEQIINTGKKVPVLSSNTNLMTKNQIKDMLKQWDLI